MKETESNNKGTGNHHANNQTRYNNAACNGIKSKKKKTKRNGLFWSLMSLFSLLLIGTVTFAMVVYEGTLLKKTIKENRAELLAELRKKREMDKLYGI